MKFSSAVPHAPARHLSALRSYSRPSPSSSNSNSTSTSASTSTSTTNSTNDVDVDQCLLTPEGYGFLSTAERIMEEAKRDKQDINDPTTRDEQVSIYTKLDVFQLQNVLQAMGVLIPNDVIISLYARASKKDQDNSTLSFADLNYFLKNSVRVGNKEDHSTKNVLKNLLALKNLGIDGFVWDTVLWVIAGVVLVVVSFTNGTILDPIRKNMGLVVSTCYGITGGKFVFGFPLKEWNAQVNIEKLTIQFKEAMLRNVAAYAESKKEKEHNKATRPSALNVDKSFSSQSSFIQLLTYIEEKIYNRNPQVVVLTKRDLENLLLKELGNSFNSRVLDAIMSIVDKDKRGTISPGELHHFLASNKLHYGPSRRCNFLPRLHSVLMITVTDFLWIFSLSFFLGSFVSALNNVVTQFGKDLTPILGSMSPGFVVAWLSLFGTIAFTQIAYEWSSDSFDLKEQAKVVLGSCVRYDSYYNRDSEIWVRYNQNNGLDKESLSRLLEEAYIILSEGELNALFKEIDHDGNGVLCKDEIEAYLADEKHRQIAILRMCLRSAYFWSNFFWFLGSIACLGPVYTTDSLTVTWCYRFGGMGYFIGSLSCAVMVYQSMVRKHSVMTKLNEVVDMLMESANEDSSRLKDKPHPFNSVYDVRPKISINDLVPKMHRFKSIIFKDPSDGFDEEAQTSSSHSYSSLNRGRGSNVTYPDVYSDPLESFLSRLIYCESEEGAKEFLVDESNQDYISKLESSPTSTLFLAKGIPLLLYCFASSDENEDDRSGILYLLCPSGSFDATIDSKEEISARLSSNGTKLHIKFPWHRHFANVMEVTNGTSQGSANLIGVMFGEGCMMASELEVDLPLEQKPSRVISSPTLIYSQNGSGPVFAHFELGESS